MIALLATLLAVAPAYELESVRLRVTHYSQTGVGYQSAAGPEGGPGSERAIIERPEAEVVARLGERVVQRVWLPVDVITAASPDHSRFGQPIDAVPDAVTTASRRNMSNAVDTMTAYRWDRETEIYFRAAFHIEEPFQSWGIGMGLARSFAEENTVLAASVHEVVDWFDRFDLMGYRHGRAGRSTVNLNLTLSQVLSPTTVLMLTYGGTLQLGTLGNTWSSVLLDDGMRGDERLPRERLRHALAARVAQWLPWQGALKVSYRAYVDDWGVRAHTVDAELAQHLGPWLGLRAGYRRHWQNAVSFFTTAASADAEQRTGDSDLDRFVAQSFRGMLSLDVAAVALNDRVRDVHVDFGYEHYFRSNGLTIDVTTCAAGFRF